MDKHNLFALALIFSGWHIVAQNNPPALIPLPAKVEFCGGHFLFSESTRVLLRPVSQELMPAATHWLSHCYRRAGMELFIIENDPGKDVIELVLDKK
ncbi:MAG TPA: hypothetical protein PLL53_21055, partial [Saprospiraceae bacterium]|nr:hypothetical protein [Saprospiraceae bacterium]